MPKATPNSCVKKMIGSWKSLLKWLATRPWYASRFNWHIGHMQRIRSAW